MLTAQAAEMALRSFARGGCRLVLQRAAKFLDVNDSGWIEEVDFHEAGGCWPKKVTGLTCDEL